jgi:hypothetical protein
MAEDVPQVAALVKQVFPPGPEQQNEFFRGIPIDASKSTNMVCT